MNKRKQLRKPRSRVVLSLSLATVISLGLASRSLSEALPVLVSAHAGDALWTIAVFLTLAFVFPKSSSLRLGLLAFLLSVLVEISQLFDTPWLNAVRDTTLGRLLLGEVFDWVDLPRYFAGAFIATLLDWILTTRHR